MHTILIADPSPFTREPLGLALQNSGYLTIEAETTQEVIEAIAQCDIAVIIMSLELPNPSDGLQAIKEINQINNDGSLIVILCADQQNQTVADKTSSIGVNNVIIKQAFCFDDLLTTLNAHGLFSDRKTTPESTPASSRSTQPPPNKPSPKPRPQKTKTPAPKPLHAPAQQTAATISDTTLLKSLPRLMDRTTADWVKQNITAPPLMPATIQRLNKLDLEGVNPQGTIILAARHDPGLCLQIIQEASSLSEKPIDSIPHGLQILGLARTADLLDQHAPNESPKDTPATQWGSLQSEAFWEHSMAVALTAEALTACQPRSGEDIESAYLAGLLHDVGRQLFVQHLNGEYQEVLEGANMLCAPLAAVEKHMLLENHATLMEHVLRRMGCRSMVCTAVGAHHDPLSRINTQSQRTSWLTQTLCLADRLAHSMLWGDSGQDQIESTAPFTKALQLTGNDITSVRQSVPDKIAAARKWALLHANQTGKPHADVLASIGTVYAGLDHETDEVLHLTQSLLPNPEAGPKIAVAHIRNPSEQQAVTRLLKQEETKLQITGLPTIVVSPRGDATLDDNRSVLKLPEPVSKKAFTKAVIKLGGDQRLQAA